jgi:hypothetical protein
MRYALRFMCNGLAGGFIYVRGTALYLGCPAWTSNAAVLSAGGGLACYRSFAMTVCYIIMLWRHRRQLGLAQELRCVCYLQQWVFIVCVSVGGRLDVI